MARRFTIEILMNLASRIGANPGKAISRSNISFLGKGPTKNPLFQNRLAGLENASAENLGDPKNLFAAIDDAVGWAKDGKLNGIQTEILGHNLSGIEKILHPPVLPSASVTPIASGIEGLKRFPKESHKFFGRPLKDKDFSEIDRMVMEGKVPDARGRTWNLKAPETGAERYNKLTGLDKSKPFQGWTPSVVPKANIPASKINHQIIADKYGIDVELIEGKDWVEVLEIIRKLGYAEGGLAEILQAPRSGMRMGGLGLLTRGIRNAFKRTKHGYDSPSLQHDILVDDASYLMSPVNMQKIKKLEIYRKQLVRDILRKEGRVGKKFNPEMPGVLKIDSRNPKPEATRSDLQLLDDYIAQLKKKIQEVGYYGEGAAKEKALLASRPDLPFPKFVRDKFKHAEGGLAGILEV